MSVKVGRVDGRSADMATYPDAMTMPDALQAHFARSGFEPDGGYASKWVKFKIAGVPLAMPNIEARREVAKYHDIHHVLTGYETDWPGEMEIGAWEVATGCGHSWVAWLLNISAFGVGLLRCPWRTFRAWCRGRRGRNLYREDYDALLGETVGVLRERTEPRTPAVPASHGDRWSFAFWSAVGLGVAAAPVLTLGGAIWAIVSAQ